MVSNLFSQSTNDTKRNLIFVSTVSLLFSFKIVDFSQLEVIQAIIKDSGHIIWMEILLLLYLNVAVYVRSGKDNAVISIGNYAPSKDEQISKIAMFLNSSIVGSLNAEKHRNQSLVPEAMDGSHFQKQLIYFHTMCNELSKGTIEAFAGIIGETRASGNAPKQSHAIKALLEEGLNSLDNPEPARSHITSMVSNIESALKQMSELDELEINLDSKIQSSYYLDTIFPNLYGVAALVIILIRAF